MKPLASFLILAVAIAGCGDNGARPDGAINHDGGNTDAPSFPAPPALGAQIDRLGRPAVGTALIAMLLSGAARTAQKDAYNHAADSAVWRTTMLQTNVTIERELATNLAVLDALDKGLATPMAGCGSALKYATPLGTTTYVGAADLFADDQLHVDTSKATCGVYLALEIEQASGGAFPHATCGGRMLGHDVIDVMYSVLASGLAGLDSANNFSPRLHDGASVHPNISMDIFPFLGAPN